MICTAVVDNQNSPLSWKHRRTSIPLQPCCSEWPVGQQHWTTWGPVRNAESWTSPWASQMALVVKNPPEMWETRGQSLGWEDALEEGMAIHSSILAWRIPRTEVPSRLQSMGSRTVGHDWVTNHSTAIAKKVHVSSSEQVRFVISGWSEVRKRVKDDTVKRDTKTQEAGLP